nr:MAG TPA: Myb2 [Caudoviricetes sp.]
MCIKWTQQEDNLLRQLDALGYSSSKIYKEYGSIKGCPIAEE